MLQHSRYTKSYDHCPKCQEKGLGLPDGDITKLVCKHCGHEESLLVGYIYEVNRVTDERSQVHQELPSCLKGRHFITKQERHITTMSTLGTVDFSVVEDFQALPAGRYPGQTKGEWEAKPTNAGDSTNVNVKLTIDYEHTDTDGEVSIRTRTMTVRYNTKPDALWRIKRDLVALGADPDALKQKNVNLEALINMYFSGSPNPIWVHLTQRPWTPTGETEAVIQNDVAKIEVRELPF